MKRLVINPWEKKSTISPEIYGHFSEHLGRCIYEGIFVGADSTIPNVNGMRTDVVEAMKQIKMPVLRWPGGCFADEYHWKDGIGPVEDRKKMINTHWGGVVEDNSFGTHEFMELCGQVGCEPYINANVGSGTVQEMSEWVEYLTFDGLSPMTELRKKNGQDKGWKVKFWGVGNENWGCGGNMTGEQYALEFRRFQTYCRNYGENRLHKIACGPSDGNVEWTEALMKIAGNYMDGLTMHMYTVPFTWADKGSALDFDESAWYRTLGKALVMDQFVTAHSQIMDRYDPKKRVDLIVDEWGTWFNVEPGTNPGFLYQQNTMRDALVAGVTLDIFNKHSDRVRMANIAQTVNVLQAIILTEGAQMVLTPTYHVFDLYKHHQGGTLIGSFVESDAIGTDEFQVPSLHESVSMAADGRIHVTLNNLSATEAQEIDGILVDAAIKSITGEIVMGDMKDHNSFDKPETIAAKAFTDLTFKDGRVSFTMPPCSVLHLAIEI